jgi:hypothetical protein
VNKHLSANKLRLADNGGGNLASAIPVTIRFRKSDLLMNSDVVDPDGGKIYLYVKLKFDGENAAFWGEYWYLCNDKNYWVVSPMGMVGGLICAEVTKWPVCKKYPVLSRAVIGDFDLCGD